MARGINNMGAAMCANKAFRELYNELQKRRKRTLRRRKVRERAKSDDRSNESK